MMKDVLEISPASKEEGLREFAGRGFFLIDATYTPIKHQIDGAPPRVHLSDDNHALGFFALSALADARINKPIRVRTETSRKKKTP
jgi:hypothetical protein